MKGSGWNEKLHIKGRVCIFSAVRSFIAICFCHSICAKRTRRQNRNHRLKAKNHSPYQRPLNQNHQIQPRFRQVKWSHGMLFLSCLFREVQWFCYGLKTMNPMNRICLTDQHLWCRYFSYIRIPCKQTVKKQLVETPPCCTAGWFFMRRNRTPSAARRSGSVKFFRDF